MRQNFGCAKSRKPDVAQWERDQGGRERIDEQPMRFRLHHPRTPLVRVRGVTAEGKQPKRTTDGLTSLSRTKSHFVLSSWVSLPIRLPCPVAIFIFLVFSAGRYSFPHVCSLCATSSPTPRLIRESGRQKKV